MQMVLMRDGRLYSGIPAVESERLLELRVANQAKPVALAKSQIASREIAPVSMMPEGLLANLSDAEVLDLVAYLLGARPVSELTIASTSQLLGTEDRTWNLELAARAGLPTGIFGELVEPGTVTGELRPDAVLEAGLTEPCPIIAAASHDTAAAVAASNSCVSRPGPRSPSSRSRPCSQPTRAPVEPGTSSGTASKLVQSHSVRPFHCCNSSDRLRSRAPSSPRSCTRPSWVIPISA